MRAPTNRTAAASVKLAALQRKPQRVTITMSAALFERLQARAMVEGRSLSNLCAYLLESSVVGGDNV